MSLPPANTPSNLLLLSAALFVAGAGVNGPKTMCGLEVREKFPVRDQNFDTRRNGEPYLTIRYLLFVDVRTTGLRVSRGIARAARAAGRFSCGLPVDTCA